MHMPSRYLNFSRVIIVIIFIHNIETERKIFPNLSAFHGYLLSVNSLYHCGLKKQLLRLAKAGSKSSTMRDSG